MAEAPRYPGVPLTPRVFLDLSDDPEFAPWVACSVSYIELRNGTTLVAVVDTGVMEDAHLGYCTWRVERMHGGQIVTVAFGKLPDEAAAKAAAMEAMRMWRKMMERV